MDPEGIELLEPVRNRSIRVVNQLRRPQASVSHADGVGDADPDVSRRLRVVYDSHFDRFFLREDTPSQGPYTPYKQLRGTGDRPQGKSKSNQCVQWEDLILPPRSATKQNIFNGVSRDPLEVSVSQSSLGDVPKISASDASHLTLNQVDPSRPTVTTMPAQEDPSVIPDTFEIRASEEPLQMQQPVEDLAIGGTTSEKPAVVSISPEEQQPQTETVATDEHTVAPSGHDATSIPVVVQSADPVSSTPQASRIKLEAWVVLLRSLLRLLRKRRGVGVSVGGSPNSNTKTEPAKTDFVSSAAGHDKDSTSQSIVSNAAAEPPVLAPQAPLSLQLDLTKITSPDPTAKKAKSPSRRSPLKKTRIANYERHFASAATSTKPTQAVEVSHADEHEVRWHGEVIHIDVEIRNFGRGNQQRELDHRPRHVQQRQPIAHLYNLKDLMRIRPTGDGFRRVNESCKFAETTSSSESESESEEEIAPAQTMSSDDAEDPHSVFKRGDRVLFYSRHRWFKGTILRRIKVSWFYDIRADNGTVFEAIQTRRICVFDGEDEKPKAIEYEVGDRVLWRPKRSDNGQDAAKCQNYKATIKRVREKGRGKGNLYDLELRAGRTIENVPSELLCPSHGHSQHA